MEATMNSWQTRLSMQFISASQMGCTGNGPKGEAAAVTCADPACRHRSIYGQPHWHSGRALASGKHVLVEKPFTADAQEAR